jgi:mannosidase alpha-like ER degradation enhancer 2
MRPRAALLVVSALALVPTPSRAQASGETLDRAALAAAVRNEARFAWHAYVEHAWGHDELRPKTASFRDWYGDQSLLMTPVDALDTLVLLGLDDEAAAARKLIDEKLTFDRDLEVQNFEITIRLLGGLLSSYQLTHDARLVALADDLGHRLMPVFASPTGMPYRFVNLRTGKVRDARSNPAEVGTLLLEFGTLSKLTGKPEYFTAAKRALLALAARRSRIGLVGEEIDVETGRWKSGASHVGGGIDSYYEYLLKGALLFDDPDCRRLWEESKRALDAHLAEDVGGHLWYSQVGMRTGWFRHHEWGALQAFFPATLALGGDLDRARRLEDSSFAMWQAHGLEPDAWDYRRGRVLSGRYPLRPEIVESAYTLHELTGDPRYLAMGKVFFDDLRAHCRTENGYTVVDDVVTMRQGNLQPSYFLAETLKYLYLLFAPEKKVDLHQVVFNTEAHPLRRAG